MEEKYLTPNTAIKNVSTQEDIARLVTWAKEQFPEHYQKKEKKEDKISCVYFISDGTYVKIGATNDLNARIKVLQTGNSRRLKVLYTIPTNEPFVVETKLHALYKDKQIRQEWYDILDKFPKLSTTYLTPKDLETMFGMSYSTVYKLMHSPGFPFVQIGKSIRVNPSNLNEYLHTNNITYNGKRLLMNNGEKQILLEDLKKQ